MEIIQSPLFKRTIKKLVKQEKKSLDDQIRKIIRTPDIGQEKKGDLAGVRVHKFNFNNTQYLLSYRINKSRLELLTFGSHENYYRDLKNYL